MGIILDIVIIAIMALSIFLGYRKGLVKIAVKLCAFLIAIIVSIVFYKPVSNIIINNTQLDEKIESVIIENGSIKIEEDEIRKDEQGEQQTNESFLENVQGYVEETVAETQNELIKKAAKEISGRLINIIVIVGLFIITRLILILLVLISDVITNIPIIKQFNKLGGILYGIIRGVLLIYSILAIVFLVVSISGNSNIIQIIESSVLTEFMYESNILLNIIF